MKHFFTALCLFLAALMAQVGIAASADAWDIVGRYEYEDKKYNYSSDITVTRDYKVSLGSRIVGGICGFNGQIQDREKKKLAEHLSANPKSVTVSVWNGETGELSDNFIFQFTPDTVILKQGPTKNFSYYCGAKMRLPDESEVLKKVK